MEALGILVADGLIEIELVDKTLGSFVITAWEKYKPVFEEIRKKHSDPFLGEYFQCLSSAKLLQLRSVPKRPPHDNI